MGYKRTHDHLSVCRLTPELSEKHMGYLFLVYSHGVTSHTAFNTLKGLSRWATERGLTVSRADLRFDFNQEAGWYNHIIGSYSVESHMDEGEFYALEHAQMTKVLDNAQYTLGLITIADDGHRTIHHLNCNVRTRPVFNYLVSRKEMS